jgi:hypothetical protein
MTVNIAGLPGHGIAADMFQEQIQDELYEHINRKDASFDAEYIKDVIAPNTHRFVALKKDVNAGLGLAKRSSRHSTPETDSELRILLPEYAQHEIHFFRKGRKFDNNLDKVDYYGRSYSLLEEAKLEAWIAESTRSRSLIVGSEVPTDTDTGPLAFEESVQLEVNEGAMTGYPGNEKEESNGLNASVLHDNYSEDGGEDSDGYDSDYMNKFLKGQRSITFDK